jgi:hypothetical protein
MANWEYVGLVAACDTHTVSARAFAVSTRAMPTAIAV